MEVGRVIAWFPHLSYGDFRLLAPKGLEKRIM
jgi:hypothetical protein